MSGSESSESARVEQLTRENETLRRQLEKAQAEIERLSREIEEDIVKQNIVRRFDIQIGHCACCGKRVQGRHRLQTSDALGAAQVQIGPQAIALSAHLNKELGISHERVARVLKLGWGLEVNRSG